MDARSLEMIEQMPPAMWACMIAGGFILWAAFWSVFCVIFHRNLAALPESHRRVSPWQNWLLVVFPFSIFWMFYVLPRISDSWRSLFQARGDAAVGHCGRRVAVWCALMSLISNGVGFLPYLYSSPAVSLFSLILSALTGFAGFILLIAFCIIINDLRLKAANPPSTDH